MKLLNKIIKYLFFAVPLLAYAQDMDSAKINYNFIDSYPQNAEIQINDNFIGHTPLFFEWKDSTFPKSVKINLEGFNEQAEIISGYQLLNKKYNLIPTGKRSVLNLVIEDKQTYFKEPRKVVPIVVSSLITAGSGFAAFYFKSLASDNRKDYDTNLDQASLDKEKKYNLLGSVSLVAFQLGFGALLYFLFLD